MQLAQCYAARRKRVGLERRIDKSSVPWLYSVGSLRHTEALEEPVLQAEVSSVCKERLYFFIELWGDQQIRRQRHCKGV